MPFVKKFISTLGDYARGATIFGTAGAAYGALQAHRITTNPEYKNLPKGPIYKHFIKKGFHRGAGIGLIATPIIKSTVSDTNYYSKYAPQYIRKVRNISRLRESKLGTLNKYRSQLRRGFGTYISQAAVGAGVGYGGAKVYNSLIAKRIHKRKTDPSKVALYGAAANITAWNLVRKSKFKKIRELSKILKKR